MKVVATFRSEHDGNSDEAILLSGLAPEPPLSRDWCVTNLVVANIMKIERPQHLHHVRHKIEAQPRKGAVRHGSLCTTHMQLQHTLTVQGEAGRDTSSTLSFPMPCVVNVRKECRPKVADSCQR